MKTFDEIYYPFSFSRKNIASFKTANPDLPDILDEILCVPFVLFPIVVFGLILVVIWFSAAVITDTIFLPFGIFNCIYSRYLKY